MPLQLISVGCKNGYEVKMTEKILEYVRETYGEDQNVENEVIEFERLRNHALMKQNDRHEGAVEALSRYYDQLTAIEGKIPMEESAVRIDFKWDDIFAKDTLFGKKASFKLASGSYERICILFNIAALHSQVAETMDFSDDIRLKNATRYLQQAAGIFSYLKAEIPVIFQRELTTDLSTDILDALSIIMVAQAQELIFTKSVRNKMKPDNIAKIAQQTSELYANSFKCTQKNSVKYVLPKEWVTLVTGKQYSYYALAEYYQAKSCNENKLYGEKIARLKKAFELMKTSISHMGSTLFHTEEECIKRDLEESEKENNMIYHDTILSEASLPLISKLVLAREIAHANPINKDFKDLFYKIVPIAFHSAMIMFQNKLNSIVDIEMSRLKMATNSLSGTLVSTNMLAVFEDNQGDEVPLLLLQKSRDLKNSGGIDKIEELLKNLPQITNRNCRILTETIQMLTDEEKSDGNLREQFKDRWMRTPSNQLTESLREESNKLTEYLKQAKMSDKIIKKHYEENYRQIRLLSQSENEIKEYIPKKGATLNDTDNVYDDEIQRIYHNIEAMKSSRVILLEELFKTRESDIAITFSKNITDNGSVNVEDVAEEQINLLLSSMKEKVQQSLDLQNRLILNFQEKCSHNKVTENLTQSRTGVIYSLFNAIDKYNELSNDLLQGMKFYGDITDILLKFQNKVKDFCFARKTEKDDLLKELQLTMVDDHSVATNFQATSNGDVNYQSAPNAPQHYNVGINPYQQSQLQYGQTSQYTSGQMQQYPGQMQQYPGQRQQYPGQMQQYPGQMQQYPGQIQPYPGLIPQYSAGQTPRFYTGLMPQYQSAYYYPQLPGNNQYHPR